jgi:hypothetical protein
MTAAALGHNGPPADTLKPLQKLALVSRIVNSDVLTSAEKCLAIAITVLADKSGETVIGFSDMQRITSTKRRDSVFKIKKNLEDAGFILKTNAPGQANHYRIMPDHVMESIAEAYTQQRRARNGPVHNSGTPPVPKTRTAPVPKTQPAPIPKTRTAPVPEMRTRPQNEDGPHALAHARQETPFGSYSLVSSEGGVGETILPEIEGLNGSTAKLADQLAGYLAGELRPKEPQIAYDILKSNVEIYGPEKVLIGMVEFQTAVASRKFKPSQDLVRAFNGYIKEAKKPKAEESVEEAALKAKMKGMDAICGGWG